MFRIVEKKIGNKLHFWLSPTCWLRLIRIIFLPIDWFISRRPINLSESKTERKSFPESLWSERARYLFMRPRNNKISRSLNEAQKGSRNTENVRAGVIKVPTLYCRTNNCTDLSGHMHYLYIIYAAAVVLFSVWTAASDLPRPRVTCTSRTNILVYFVARRC